MKNIFVLTFIAVATIHAAPSIDKDVKVKTFDLTNKLSGKFNQDKLNEIVQKMIQQHAAPGDSDPQEQHYDKVAVLKKMLKKEMKLPEALKAANAIQTQTDSEREADLKKRFEVKMGEAKARMSRNFPMSDSNEKTLQSKFEEKMKSLIARKSL
ncbi:CLUMA_CG002393, isoform A [Clunio marinus]|uniref:CLUMA_CG002393, isoform A n=1 Tax=Clunio marinus TaxID=568069 RepID=A0A1J1HMI9_9DIPT|nr:CLUMA_CG002393, isoform A [Clunio marinus]